MSRSASFGVMIACRIECTKAASHWEPNPAPPAPVLLVIGGGYINSWKPLDPVAALPLSIYENAKSEWPSLRTEVWGIALVLVVFVFVLSLSARIWASRKQQAR